jgi:hypothetical protein
VSVWSSRVVPEIVGATVLTGGVGSTRAAAADVAEVEPAVFVADDDDAGRRADVGAREPVGRRVAPLMSVQFAPFRSHRRHW